MARCEGQQTNFGLVSSAGWSCENATPVSAISPTHGQSPSELPTARLQLTARALPRRLKQQDTGSNCGIERLDAVPHGNRDGVGG